MESSLSPEVKSSELQWKKKTLRNYLTIRQTDILKGLQQRLTSHVCSIKRFDLYFTSLDICDNSFALLKAPYGRRFHKMLYRKRNMR